MASSGPSHDDGRSKSISERAKLMYQSSTKGTGLRDSRHSLPPAETEKAAAVPPKARTSSRDDVSNCSSHSPRFESTGSLPFDFSALDDAVALGAAARKDIMASEEPHFDEDDDSYSPDVETHVHSNLRANIASYTEAQALPPPIPSGHAESVWKGTKRFVPEQNNASFNPSTLQPSTGILQRFQTMRTRRAASHELWCKVSNVQVPLVLLPTDDNFRVRASALPYNALAVELRDLYRILDGMGRKSEQGQLVIKDVTIFYEWFEGFFGIFTSLYETLDDVMFPWIEKIGAVQLAKALSPKRRKAKHVRTKDVCWDILELKMMLQKSADKSRNTEELSALVHEVAGEADVMALRILAFVSAMQNELPNMMTNHFQDDELDIMEETLIQNLRASNPGKFVLCAFTRALDSPDARAAYLDRVFLPKKTKKNTGLKEYKKYYTRHVDLVDVLAVGKKMPCAHREQEDTDYERSNYGAGDSKLV